MRTDKEKLKYKAKRIKILRRQLRQQIQSYQHLVKLTKKLYDELRTYTDKYDESVFINGALLSFKKTLTK